MKSQHAMYGAIARGDAVAARAVLDSDPDILGFSFSGKSWLHKAAQSGKVEIMEVLVGAGIPVDRLDDAGHSTPLMVAAGQPQVAACICLLEHGADVNHGLGTSATPIFPAIYGKSLELVSLFIERGADLRGTLRDGKTGVIEFARMHGTPEIVELLLRHTPGQGAAT